MKAYIFALIAAFLWGFAPIFGKLGLEKTTPMIGLSIRTMVTAFFLVIALSVKGEFGQFLTLKKTTLGLLALEGLFASALGHLFYFYALKYGEASRMTPLMSSFPIITFTLAIIFLHEAFTWTKFSGALFILIGVLLITK